VSGTSIASPVVERSQIVSQPNDIIGPWSESKLDLLRKYLSAYTGIMRGKSGAETATTTLTLLQAQGSLAPEMRRGTLMALPGWL
jgi:hypothetical protein